MKKTIEKTFLYSVLLGLCSMNLSSCATIFGKSSYPVSINSVPTAANITIIDRKGMEVFKGQTPAIATLRSSAGYMSRAEYQIKINAPGYKEQIIPVTAKLNGWYFANILLGGVIGMLIVDPVSGAMYRLDKQDATINVNLVATDAQQSTLIIKDINSLSKEDQAKLVRIN